MIDFIKRHKLSLIVLLFILVGIPGYFVYRSSGEENNIKTASVNKGTIKESISASGSVEAAEKAVLRFQTSGRLSWVGVKKGDYVRKNQAIASLDKRELEKTLRKELNEYTSERWDFEQERDERLITDDNLDKYTLTDEIRRILEKAQFDLDNKVIDVEIQDLALKYATLFTPVSGIVTEIEQPYAGVNITAATAEFTVVNPMSVEFVAEVDEVDISKVKVGQKAVIYLDSYPDEEFKSTIREIDFTSTTTSGGGTAYLARLDLPENIDNKFRQGMNGDVSFEVSQRKGIITVAQSAITSKDNNPAVWVVDKDNKAKLVVVELGVETSDKAEILSGIKEGQTILTEGFEDMEEGEEIRYKK